MRLLCWKLKDIIEEEGLTQKAAAKRYGIAQAQISRYLSGQQFPARAAKKIDEDYARLFGADAAPANPLPARMTRRINALPPDEQRVVFTLFEAFLATRP